MRKLLQCVLATFVCCALLFSPTSIFAEDEPGEAEGKKIGTVIKTAVTTALPGFQPLIDLIWPKKSNDSEQTNINKNEREKIIKDAKKIFMIDAQKGLTGVSDTVREIALVKKFVEPSVRSHEYITRIRAMMATSNINWAAVKLEWDLAAAQLGKIGKIKEDDLKFLQNDIEFRLVKIKQINDELQKRISACFKQKTPKRGEGLCLNIDAQLMVTADRLADITLLLGLQLDQLGSELNGLAKWAKGEAGPPSVEDGGPAAMLDKRLDETSKWLSSL